mmetsp:Transcript_6868/g.20886  ORF Transcript_6868/g.20886 Transcript_6868/m.20886 type:complete len:431 (+) Transcript_6868:570-1862(+)
MDTTGVASLALDDSMVLLDGWMQTWLVFESEHDEVIGSEDLDSAIVCRVQNDCCESEEFERSFCSMLFLPTMSHGDWVLGKAISAGSLLFGAESSAPVRFCIQVGSVRGTVFVSSVQCDGTRVVRRVDRHESGDVFVSMRGLHALREPQARSTFGSITHGREICSLCGPQALGCQCALRRSQAFDTEYLHATRLAPDSNWHRWSILCNMLINDDARSYGFVEDRFRYSSEQQRWIAKKSGEHRRLRWHFYDVSGARQEEWGTTLLGRFYEHVRAREGEAGPSRRSAEHSDRQRSSLSSGCMDTSAEARLRSTPRQVYACSECGSTFPTRSRLRRHVRGVHLQMRTFSCSQCTRSFAQNCHLIKHIQDVHEQRRNFECPECSKCFTSRYKVKRHMVIHRRPEDRCPVCREGLADVGALRRHMKEAHYPHSS